MEYVKMAEGLQYSRVVLGFWRLLDWNLTTDELIRYLEECLDIGITTMDHADIYGNYTVEEKFGEALKKRPDLRGKMQIISKYQKLQELSITITAGNTSKNRLRNR